MESLLVYTIIAETSVLASKAQLVWIMTLPLVHALLQQDASGLQARMTAS